MLSRLYGLSTEEALLYTQVLHDIRRYPQNVRSPQTQVQVDQVRRILGAERVGMKACEYQWPDLPLKPYAANESYIPARTLTNAYRMPPLAPIGSSSNNLPPALPVFIKPDTTMSSAKAVAAAAALDPPIRSTSLIPAGVQGGGELTAANSGIKRNNTSPQPSGTSGGGGTSPATGKVGLQLVLPLAQSDTGRV
jgi:hypothetical protein